MSIHSAPQENHEVELNREPAKESAQQSVKPLQELLASKLHAIDELHPTTDKAQEELILAKQLIEARRLLSLQLAA